MNHAKHLNHSMSDAGGNGAAILEKARVGIKQYLDSALAAGRIDSQLYGAATKNTFPFLEKWWNSDAIEKFSPGYKAGVTRAIEAGQWESIVNAYRQQCRFGTGGIRGMMAFDRQSIVMLKEQGIHAPILKGPNTINDIVMLLMSAGVAKFGKEQKPPLEKIVIGYDSRVRGADLAAAVAQLFLAYGYTVYFFDAPCPYPLVTFAIPHSSIKADMGILISASHNDYRYNGYKLSCSNGSQFDPQQRDLMYNNYIAKATFEDVKLTPFRDAAPGKLFFLGGSEPLPGVDYYGKQGNLIDIHSKHREHVSSFLLMKDLKDVQAKSADPLKIGYCAFHGAGRVAVPRLLEGVGIRSVKPVHKNGLHDLNGLFPSFNSDPGKEQQPDPGDTRAAKVFIEAFKEEYPGEFEKTDLFLGTDPDADRCGIIVKVPPEQRELYDGKDYALLPADDAWTLLLWYRLTQEMLANGGKLPDADKKFITLSMTTSDAITLIARKYGVGVIRTWVGFAALAASIDTVWNGQVNTINTLVDGRDPKSNSPVCHATVCDTFGMDEKRSFNIAAMEQSNGFSLLGGKPKDTRSLGELGHVRDKDGTLAALLMAEVAAWAKHKGTTLLSLLDEHVYTDPDVGLFANFYEPDPLDGEYPGIEGDKLKKAILRRALSCLQLALAGDLEIAGKKIKSAVVYRTGKYDAIYPPTADFVFPDEGVRLFFDDEKLQHVTIRPSGTGNSLRFHVQLHARPTKANLLATKLELKRQGNAILDHVRQILKAPR
jgi:phosphoglucomutase